MKRILFLIITALIILSLTACQNETVKTPFTTTQSIESTSPSVIEEKIAEFSYELDRKNFFEKNCDIKIKGFTNTCPQENLSVDDLIKLAKYECPENYTLSDIDYDLNTHIYRLLFAIERGESLIYGDCETVYMSDEGITLLVIAGE